MKTNTLFLLILLAFLSCNSKPEQNAQNKQQTADFISGDSMAYRSVSFHVEPDSLLIKRAAALGFNDVCQQVEGNTLKGFQRLRHLEDQKGYFKLAKSLGMTISVWTREINDYNEGWGEISVNNQVLWDSLTARYDYYMTELLPEVDYWVLSVVETQFSIADADVLNKVVTVLNNACKKNNKKLIIRTFVHYPHELDNIKANLPQLPDDVIIQTKFVASDWNLRGPHNPVIGQVGEKAQFIELDICGEYWRNTYVPNCFTDKLEERYRYWLAQGCDGISVRVSRSPRPGAWWEPLRYRHVVVNEPNEVNLWVLGYLSTGRSAKQAWQDFAKQYFGDAANEIIPILKAQGAILAEALHVATEPFGCTRLTIPAEWIMNGEHCKCGDLYAVAYPDSADMLYRNPFHAKYSPWVWDSSLAPQYQKIRRGHPDIIVAKSKAFKKQTQAADSAIAAFKNLQGLFDDKTFEYYLFKLEENRFHLQVMCHCELAWLKASQQLYDEKADNRAAILKHLEALQALEDQKINTPPLQINWYGHRYDIRRAEYLDIPGFLALFRNYWRID